MRALKVTLTLAFKTIFLYQLSLLLIYARTKNLLMKQIIAFVFFLLLFSANLFSQNKTEDFEITLPLQKLKIVYIRPSNSTIRDMIPHSWESCSLVRFNRKSKVIPEMPKATQIKNVLEYRTDSSAQTDGLIFQLRQLSIKYLRQC